MHPRLGSGCEVRVRGYARSAQAGELLHDLVGLAAPTHIYPDPAQFCRRTVNADAAGMLFSLRAATWSRSTGCSGDEDSAPR